MEDKHSERPKKGASESVLPDWCASALDRPIPNLLRRVYAFNQYERDRWVQAQAAKIPEGSRVLDVGAGSCPYRRFFAHCEYKSHDLAQLQPEQLSSRRGYGDIDYVSDILSIPVPEGSHDVILCTEVLEHVPDPVGAIREFARILRPGGHLILTAPLGSGLHQKPYHFYGGFTSYWYRKFLTEAGFEDITIQPNGGFFKHYGQESMRFALLTAPWQGGWGRLAWLPVWLLAFPWFVIICPLLGYLLDRLDSDKGCTVGYHVKAVRVRPAEILHMPNTVGGSS
jgi:ubiquinone/menaquinone biosynthesis C-methylase UbiE